MRRLPGEMVKLTPQDADRIFSSHVDEGDPELGALAAFVREVRDSYARAPDANTQARHLRAMAEEFAAAPRPAPARRPRRVLRRAAAVGAVGALFAGGSALAATGNLPAPAQNAVAQAVEHVGLKIPKAKKHASTTGQEHGDAGKARAAANKTRAKAFTDAKNAWTACVAEKAPESSGPGSFDAEAPEPQGCGPKPKAQDFQPTRTNPAGHENHGKGPEPKQGKPAEAGLSSGEGQGNGPPATPTPSAPGNSASRGPGHGNGVGQGNAGQ